MAEKAVLTPEDGTVAMGTRPKGESACILPKPTVAQDAVLFKLLQKTGGSLYGIMRDCQSSSLLELLQTLQFAADEKAMILSYAGLYRACTKNSQSSDLDPSAVVLSA